MIKRHQILMLHAFACTAGILAGCAMSPAGRLSVPDVVPLGSISRAHWHRMETNAEASDFIIYRGEFVDNSTELSPYGIDHIAEISARMPTAPFPVLVERSINNADPELDTARQRVVVQVLTDLGNEDAAERTVVSQAYSRGIHSQEAEQDYNIFRFTRVGGGFGGGGFGGGFGGGGGGAGFSGAGF